MAKGQKAVPIDSYTYALLQRAIDEGKANNLADAILRGISHYLNIRYKSPQERRMEQEVSRINELGKKAMREE